MARRLIGLDVGTNAVTIAEVTPGTIPRLDLFAQVALSREAMREGEVADEEAVTNAVARLRSEVGLKKADVRVGIASPRVVVRQVEMPVMTRDELASSLEFQAADLIPIPIEDAVLDFAILGQHPNDDGEPPTMQVLLAAAYDATVRRLVSAVEAGGMHVAAVDLMPLALARALAHRVPAPALASVSSGGVAVAEAPAGAEGIVSFGGGVTSIAVHEDGVPRFVRVIGSGGRELTDAIATDLSVPPETAEALKRALSTKPSDEMVARARTAIDRPLSVLLDEVRSSLDYYRNQPGSARLARVIVTGGSAQLPGLGGRLSALVGVPVEPALMHDTLRIGNIGFSAEEMPRLEPYLPAAVGLALGGADVGTVIDLRPRQRSRGTGRARPKIDQRVIAAGLGAVLLLGGGTYLAHKSAADAKAKEKSAEASVTKLENEIAAQAASSSSGRGASSALLQAEAVAVLGNDVSWVHTLSDITAAFPPGVKLTSFQGQHPVSSTPLGSATPSATPGAATSSPSGASTASSGATASSAPSASGATGVAPAAFGNPTAICAAIPPVTGTITMTGSAPTLSEVSQLLTALKKVPDVANAWITNVQRADSTTPVTFTLTAQLAKGARGHRLETFLKVDPCK